MSQNNPFIDACQAFAEQASSFAPSFTPEQFQNNAQELSKPFQEFSQQQLKIAQANFEKAYDAVREISGSKSPAQAAEKAQSVSKELAQKSLEDAQELAKLASDAAAKTYELWNKQFSEFSKSAAAASAPKKKAA